MYKLVVQAMIGSCVYGKMLHVENLSPHWAVLVTATSIWVEQPSGTNQWMSKVITQALV